LIEAKVRKGTFQHIENELFDYHETRKEIIRIRNELLYASPSHENTGGGRSSLPSDPTGRTASLMASHRQLVKMEEMIDAIQVVFDRLPKEKQQLITLRYWTRPQTRTWEGIAQELHTSRITAYRWRDEVIQAIAYRLGWR
jgi:RinA family phage transcriptional activator